MKKELEHYIKDFFTFAIPRVSAIKRYNTRKFISPQSVLEHLGSVTLITMVLSDYFNSKGIPVNTEKALRIAITHDLDEVVSGDIPHDAKYQYGKNSEKLREALSYLTEQTIKAMYSRLNNKELEKKYLALYYEEKEKKTIEAKIVKLADFIDVMIYSSVELSLGNSTILPEKKNSTKRYQELLEKVISDYGCKNGKKPR